jgi:hypothetical protein
MFWPGRGTCRSRIRERGVIARGFGVKLLRKRF